MVRVGRESMINGAFHLWDALSTSVYPRLIKKQVSSFPLLLLLFLSIQEFTIFDKTKAISCKHGIPAEMNCYPTTSKLIIHLMTSDLSKLREEHFVQSHMFFLTSSPARLPVRGTMLCESSRSLMLSDPVDCRLRRSEESWEPSRLCLDELLAAEDEVDEFTGLLLEENGQNNSAWI